MEIHVLIGAQCPELGPISGQWQTGSQGLGLTMGNYSKISWAHKGRDCGVPSGRMKGFRTMEDVFIGRPWGT